jgi:LCP family protein required for cell wall assembly
MNDSKSPVARGRGAALWRGAAVALAGIIGISAIITGPAVEPARAILDLAATTYTTAQSARILGRDGRFTILLLGSDARAGRIIGRTDAILVASVDPVTGRAAVFSIPRDTVNFPLSARRKYPGKINALYPYLVRTQGSRVAGTSLRKIVGNALGIEIDAYALIGFTGFRRLVNNVGGVDVWVARTFTDRFYSMRRGQRGVTFRRGVNHLEDLRALAFARTRHADNDYARARRQQQLIIAAIQKVQSRGPESLAGLLAASTGFVKTDLPLVDAPLIYAIVGQADLAHAPRTVFGPRTYASSIGLSRIVLRLTVCRTWIRRNFPPVHANGMWLPPEPTPVTPEPTPVTPEPTPVTPEPTPVTPEPTPVTPEPTPVTPETPAP